MRTASRHRTTHTLLLAALALLGCSGTGDKASTLVEPSFNDNVAAVRISANVAGTPIDKLLVVVSGTGIPVPLAFNLDVSNNVASGTLKVPAGAARTFFVQAFDSNGEITHDGSKTTDVARGQNPPITISLVPRNGTQPVQIYMGDYSVVLSPASKSLQVGTTTQLSAVVTAPNGDHPSPQVLWATLDPSIATVDQAGLVTAKRFGQTQIMATYGGVAGTMNIVVLDPNAPLQYQGPVYPPPGGVTFTPGTGTGIEGLAGGRTNTYKAFDLSQLRYLAFGVDSRDMPALMFNATAATTSVDAGARMSIDMNASNPGTGVIVYGGATQLPLANGSLVPVKTRLTLTLSTFIGGAVGVPALDGAQDKGFDPSIGGFAKITNPFTGADEFRVNILFEASTDNGATWGPAYSVFNSYPLKNSNATTRSSFTGAFYYSY
jgi:hypothetical protein